MNMPFYVSPEQLMKDRADYARKGIGRGRSVAVVQYDDGVLFVSENPSQALHKISEIYDRIAFAAVGRYNEFENLRIAGVRLADMRGYAYDRRDVTGRGLANAYAQTLGSIFSSGAEKPYEVEIFVAELGASQTEDQVFRLTYDGQVADEQGFAAMGGQAESVTSYLSERWVSDMSLQDALRLAVAALGHGESDDRVLPASDLEVAVLDRARAQERKFRRITGAPLSDLLGPPPPDVPPEPGPGSDGGPDDGPGADPTGLGAPAVAPGLVDDSTPIAPEPVAPEPVAPEPEDPTPVEDVFPVAPPPEPDASTLDPEPVDPEPVAPLLDPEVGSDGPGVDEPQTVEPEPAVSDPILPVAPAPEPDPQLDPAADLGPEPETVSPQVPDAVVTEPERPADPEPAEDLDQPEQADQPGQLDPFEQPARERLTTSWPPVPPDPRDAPEVVEPEVAEPEPAPRSDRPPPPPASTTPPPSSATAGPSEPDTGPETAIWPIGDLGPEVRATDAPSDAAPDLESVTDEPEEQEWTQSVPGETGADAPAPGATDWRAEPGTTTSGFDLYSEQPVEPDPVAPEAAETPAESADDEDDDEGPPERQGWRSIFNRDDRS